MRLPGGSRAVVPLEKLHDYCLNPTHPEGRHKARVFLSALGLEQSDSSVLQDALLHAAAECEATVAGETPYGTRYTIDFEMGFGEKTAKIRSGWIVRDGEDFPRLTSCYVDA